MIDNVPSLRRSLLRYLLIPLSVLLILSSTVIYLIARNYANSAYDRALFDSVETIEKEISFIDGKATLDLPEVAWKILRFDELDKIYFSVRQADGHLLEGDADIPYPSPETQATGQAIFHDGTLHGKTVRIASLYTNLDGQEKGETGRVLVQVAETLHKREKVVRDVLWTVVIPQLILVLLAGVSVWIGVTRSLAPLEQLRDAIGKRTHRDLSPIQERSAPREVQPLLRAINDLMQRMSQVLDVQRHFIADASHQLRTPLAGLSIQTELALRQSDPKALQHSLGQIRAGVERTNHLVHQLLALARAEAGSYLSQKFESVNLDEVASMQTAEWVPQAMLKQIDLDYEGPGKAITIHGQAILLREMLANVLDNAIRYTPRGGKIAVRLVVGKHPLLTVEDSGPGVPPEERERIFERFYRAADNDEPGIGLGLAIVREIAQMHGAHTWLESASPQGGTRVNIEFRNPPAP